MSHIDEASMVAAGDGRRLPPCTVESKINASVLRSETTRCKHTHYKWSEKSLFAEHFDSLVFGLSAARMNLAAMVNLSTRTDFLQHTGFRPLFGGKAGSAIDWVRTNVKRACSCNGGRNDSGLDYGCKCDPAADLPPAVASRAGTATGRARSRRRSGTAQLPPIVQKIPGQEEEAAATGTLGLQSAAMALPAHW